MTLKTFVAGIAGAVVLGSSALAADVPTIVVPAPAPVVVPVVQVFDWSGPYAGAAYQAYRLAQTAIGYNFAPGRLVLGVEFNAGIAFGGGAALALGAATRVGVALGERERLLAYGKVAAYYLPAVPGLVPLRFMAGAELAITDRLSIYAEGGANSFVTGGGLLFSGATFGVGVNFHFGR